MTAPRPLSDAMLRTYWAELELSMNATQTDEAARAQNLLIDVAGSPSNVAIEGESARDITRRQIDALRDDAVHLAHAMGRQRWLNGLRLVYPTALLNDVASAFRLRSQAEHLACWNGAVDPKTGAQGTLLDSRSIELVGRMIHRCGFLDAQRAALARLAFQPDGVLIRAADLTPKVVLAGPVDDAIDLFNERHGAEQDYVGVIGTRLLHKYAALSEISFNSLVFLGYSDDLTPIDLWDGLAMGGPSGVAMHTQFIPENMSFDEALAVLGPASQNLSPQHRLELSALAFLMRSWSMNVVAAFGKQDEGDRRWLRTIGRLGISSRPTGEFEAQMADRLDLCRDWLVELDGANTDRTSAELTAAARTADISHYPFFGPAVLDGGDATVVDVVAAQDRLTRLLDIAPAGGGRTANTRGRHLERVVQDAVDRSTWAPSNTARSLIGPVETESGVTDIDAVMEKGPVLAIIEVKSFPRRPEYSSSWKIVASRDDRIRQVVRLQEQRRAHLEEDLRQKGLVPGKFARVEAFTCISAPLYMALGDATRMTSFGLRTVFTLDELHRVLRPRA